MPDINYWLARKYAILGQEADATTQNAATNALTGKAAAALDATRTQLLPTESAAQVANTIANTNLLGEQAKVVGPESQARIGQMNAETAYTGTQNKVLTRQGLTPLSTLLGGSLDNVFPRGYNGYSLGNVVPPEPPINSAARVKWLDDQQPPWPY